MLRVPTGYKGDNHSACENNQDAREAMARSSTGLTWAYANRRTSAGPSGLLQPMGGSLGDQVQLKSSQGVQYKRNIQHVKQFVTPATEPRGPSVAEPAEVPCEQMCGQEPTSSPEMGTSAGSVEDQSPIQQQLLPRR